MSKTIVVLAVIVAIGLVFVLKNTKPEVGPDVTAASSGDAMPPAGDQTADADVSAAEDEQSDKPLPVFVEVGAQECIPCKMMKPVLAELRNDYAGRLEIEFADVWAQPELGAKYNVSTIPTQVIYDANGQEVFRHVGYWPKEEIDAKLTELDIAQ